MNKCVELHDSEVDLISEKNGDIVISFSNAYIHQSERVPGVDPGIGGYLQAELVVREGTVDALPIEWPYTIYEGYMIVNDATLDNVIPIPLEAFGYIEIQLRMFNDIENCIVTIQGKAAKLTLYGELNNAEIFPGMDNVT